MQTHVNVDNPFALMLDPESVFKAIDRSDRLARLRSEIFRPLDKPLISTLPEIVVNFDLEIDCEPETED